MKPEVGDKYYPFFESDYSGDPHLLTIKSVDSEYDDGGYQITASDKVGYDCYWSEKLNLFVYALE